MIFSGLMVSLSLSLKDVLILYLLDNFCLTPELKFAIFTFAKV